MWFWLFVHLFQGPFLAFFFSLACFWAAPASAGGARFVPPSDSGTSLSAVSRAVWRDNSRTPITASSSKPTDLSFWQSASRASRAWSFQSNNSKMIFWTLFVPATKLLT